MGDHPRRELLAGLASLYHSRQFSDLVISGRGASRHLVHRAIVCPRSRHLYTAVEDLPWREGTESVVVLDDDDELVRLIVEYLYLLDYDPIVGPSADHSSHHHHHHHHSASPPASSRNDASSVRTDAGQYGHIYGGSAVSAFGGPARPLSPFAHPFRAQRDVSALTVHAMPVGPSAVGFDAFRRDTPTRAGSRTTSAPEPSPLATREPHLVLHARMYVAAEKYGMDGLKALSLDKFKMQLTRHWDSPELAEAIHIVYTSTPPTDKDMREAVADALDWHPSLLEKPEIEIAIMEINGLAFELLKRSRRAEPEYMD